MKDILSFHKKCKNFYIPLFLYTQMYGNLMEPLRATSDLYPTKRENMTNKKLLAYNSVLENIEYNLKRLYPFNEITLRKEWEDLKIVWKVKEPDINEHFYICLSFIGDSLPTDEDCYNWICVLFEKTINPAFLECPWKESIGMKVGFTFQGELDITYTMSAPNHRSYCLLRKTQNEQLL